MAPLTPIVMVARGLLFHPLFYIALISGHRVLKSLKSRPFAVLCCYTSTFLATIWRPTIFCFFAYHFLQQSIVFQQWVSSLRRAIASQRNMNTIRGGFNPTVVNGATSSSIVPFLRLSLLVCCDYHYLTNRMEKMVRSFVD